MRWQTFKFYTNAVLFERTEVSSVHRYLNLITFQQVTIFRSALNSSPSVGSIMPVAVHALVLCSNPLSYPGFFHVPPPGVPQIFPFHCSGPFLLLPFTARQGAEGGKVITWSFRKTTTFKFFWKEVFWAPFRRSNKLKYTCPAWVKSSAWLEKCWVFFFLKGSVMKNQETCNQL